MAYIFADSIAFRLHKIVKRNRRVAVAGYDDNAHRFAEKLKRKSYSNFVGHIGHNTEVARTNAEILSGYINFAKKNKVKELYISIQDDGNDNITALEKEAEKHCIRLNFIGSQQNSDTGFYHISYIDGTPVLRQYKEPLKDLHKQIFKRFFDLLVSTLVIVFILSWLIPLVSVLIKLDSKGPVFFKQLRSGRDNNSFICLKFRSMHINIPSDNMHTIKNDNRITRVGKFLRKTSLDEFPQFLNVFLGDMSIVGPRPHMLYHTEQYSDRVKHYMVRLYLKPGLTGWAQVNGYRGEVKNLRYMEQRVEHDIWYMENWNPLLDIKIMYITFLDVLKGDEMAY